MAMNTSSIKVFKVLDVLFRNFASGYTPSDLAKATDIDSPTITRIVNTLVEAGYAERTADTGRIRLSMNVARKAIQIMQSIESAEQRLQETKHRLLTPN